MEYNIERVPNIGRYKEPIYDALATALPKLK